jgi:hypothetical protein
MKIFHDICLKWVLVVTVYVCGALGMEMSQVAGPDSRSIIGDHSK